MKRPRLMFGSLSGSRTTGVEPSGAGRDPLSEPTARKESDPRVSRTGLRASGNGLAHPLRLVTPAGSSTADSTGSGTGPGAGRQVAGPATSPPGPAAPDPVQLLRMWATVAERLAAVNVPIYPQSLRELEHDLRLVADWLSDNALASRKAPNA